MSLHGTRSTAARRARLSGFEQLAQIASAVVVFPEAIEPVGTGYKWDPGQDVDYIAGVVTELLSRHRTPHGRVLLTGMSGGARMSSLFASVHPELVQAVGAVAGLRSPGVPRRSVPILSFHGTNDRVNPVRGQRHATLERKRPRCRPGMGAERPRTSGRDRRHRRQRLRPRRSWLLTQFPARTAEVREISPASTVAAQISESLRTLPLP